MASRIIFWIVLILIFSALELYIFYGVSSAFKGALAQKIAKYIHLGTIIFFIGGVAYTILGFQQGMAQTTLFRNLIVGISFTILVTKLVFASFLLLEDIYRMLRFLIEKIVALSSSGDEIVTFEGRRRFVGKVGLAIAAIPFSSMIYGVIRGKYNYKIHDVNLTFDDLPEAFNGLKVVQISDVHSGSFDSYENVRRGVQMIQDQNPDVILFTGDLVNNKAYEIEPYMDLFKALKAPYGKFSVLGNHDYGDYVQWPDAETKQANLEKLMEHHESMGFTLLNNDSRTFEKQGQKIQLAGVENWGSPPFPQHGDIDKAFNGVDDADFTILMSHDPSHWDQVVVDHNKHTHLTLSGHTHGMQFGIEIPGIKWSPVKYRYPRWAGLYEKAGQYLYVNRGFGFLGFPGRVGIWPEITVLELNRA